MGYGSVSQLASNGFSQFDSAKVGQVFTAPASGCLHKFSVFVADVSWAGPDIKAELYIMTSGIPVTLLATGVTAYNDGSVLPPPTPPQPPVVYRGYEFFFNPSVSLVEGVDYLIVVKSVNLTGLSFETDSRAPYTKPVLKFDTVWQEVSGLNLKFEVFLEKERQNAPLTTKIKVRRGNVVNLPSLDIGEVALTLDMLALWVGTPYGNKALGERGVPGLMGATGPVGPVGPIGPTGITGPTGPGLEPAEYLNSSMDTIVANDVVAVQPDGTVVLADVVQSLDTVIGFSIGEVPPGVTGLFNIRKGFQQGGFSGLTPGKKYWVSRVTRGGLTDDVSDFLQDEAICAVGHAATDKIIMLDAQLENGVSMKQFQVTLTQEHIDNRYVDVMPIPRVIGSVLVFVGGAPYMSKGNSFIVEAPGRINWGGYSLEASLIAGDTMNIVYF